MQNNYSLKGEAAVTLAAAIDNGAREASSTETENAQTNTEQVNNPQSCSLAQY